MSKDMVSVPKKALRELVDIMHGYGISELFTWGEKIGLIITKKVDQQFLEDGWDDDAWFNRDPEIGDSYLDINEEFFNE